jgi:hypothetical protein
MKRSSTPVINKRKDPKETLVSFEIDPLFSKPIEKKTKKIIK